MASSSACACSTPRPGFSRTMDCSIVKRRDARSSGLSANGVQMSAASGKSNLGGITPVTW